MKNYKTDKWYRVVIDYVDWYYKRENVREYLGLDNSDWWIVFPWNRELWEIRDIDISDEWVEYLLYRKLGKGEEFIDRRDTSKFEEDKEWYEKNYWEFERDYEIRPFYISYYWSWQYRVQYCEAKEAEWILLIKRQDKKEVQESIERSFKKAFESYMNWEFYQLTVYSPHEGYFKEKELAEKYHIIVYEYDMSGCFFYSEEECIDWLPEEVGKIIPESLKEKFQDVEMVKNTDN